MDKDTFNDLLGDHAVAIARWFGVNPRRVIGVRIELGGTTVEYFDSNDDVATITKSARPNIRRALGDI